MSQEMNILRCYSCKMYQVHIVKKAKKWQCKLCNEKQSMQQVYFRGSGKDCRENVKKLNLLKQNESQFENACVSTDDIENDYNNHEDNSIGLTRQTSKSKWTKYLKTAESTEINNLETSSEDLYASLDSKDDVYESTPEIDTYISQIDLEKNKNDMHETMGETSGTIQNYYYNKNDDTINETESEITSKNNIFENHDDFDMSLNF